MKFYCLSLFFSLFVCSHGYIHLIERTIANFDEKLIYEKSCKNCKYFIENDNIELSRCSKFMKPKNRNRSMIGKEYKVPLVQYIKVNGPNYYDESDKFSTILLFYLATTCRKNETMCGVDAKYYERKYYDIY